MSTNSVSVAPKHGISAVHLAAVRSGLRDVVAGREPGVRLNRQQVVDELYETVRQLKAEGYSFEAVARALGEFGAEFAMSSHSLLTRLRRYEARMTQSSADVAVSDVASRREKASAARSARRRAARATAKADASAREKASREVSAEPPATPRVAAKTPKTSVRAGVKLAARAASRAAPTSTETPASQLRPASPRQRHRPVAASAHR